MSEVPSSPDTTPFLGLQKLSKSDKKQLTEQPDHGVKNPEGIRRYSTFERWQETGGVFGKNNFWLHFASGITGDMKRELPWMQRFAHLYPGLQTQLEEMTQPKADYDGLPPVSEDEERLYWQAYEKIADLVDVDDPYITNEQDLPEGHAFPGVLTG